MEYTKETIDELKRITDNAYELAKLKAENCSTSEDSSYEVDVTRFYIDDLIDKVKFNIQLKNDWKQKATKLQVK